MYYHRKYERYSILALVVCMLIIFGCKQKSDHLSSGSNMQVELGVGLGTVKFGMTEDEVIKHFGKPERIEKHGENKTMMLYLSEGFGIYVFKEHGVQSFTFTTQKILTSALKTNNFKGTTKEGIGIGASEAQIEAAYGKPTESSIQSGRKTLSYKALGIDFIMLSDKVAQFTIRIPIRKK